MKRSIVLVIMIIVFACLFAQPERQMGKPDADTILQHHTEKLNLTVEQQEAIKPLIEEQLKLMEEFHSKDQRSNQTKSMEIQKENENIAEKIKSHLDKKQQVEYETMRDEMKQNRGRRPRRSR